MVRKFRVSAVLNMAADEFFLERDSAAFRALVAKMLDLGRLEFEDEWEEDGGVVVVKQTTYPDFHKYVPGAVANLAQKYIGSALVYSDILRYDPAKVSHSPYQIDVTSIPPVFKDKTDFRSRLIIEEVTATTCCQTLEGSLEMRVGMGLGKLAEKIIAQQLEKVYSSIPQVVDCWVKFREEMMKTPEGRAVLVAGRPKPAAEWMVRRIQELLQGEPGQPSPARKDSGSGAKPPPPGKAGATAVGAKLGNGAAAPPPAQAAAAAASALGISPETADLLRRAAQAASKEGPRAHELNGGSGAQPSAGQAAEPGPAGPTPHDQATAPDQATSPTRQAPAAPAEAAPSAAPEPEGGQPAVPGGAMGPPRRMRRMMRRPDFNAAFVEWSAFWVEVGVTPAALRGKPEARARSKGLCRYLGSCACCNPNRHISEEREQWAKSHKAAGPAAAPGAALAAVVAPAGAGAPATAAKRASAEGSDESFHSARSARTAATGAASLLSAGGDSFRSATSRPAWGRTASQDLSGFVDAREE